MKTFPLLPVRNTVVFPFSSVFLSVGREISIGALKEARKLGGTIIVAAQKEEHESPDDVDPGKVHLVGTLCQLRKMTGNDKNGYQILVTGLSRFKISKISSKDSYLIAKGAEFPDSIDESTEAEALFNNLKSMAKEVLDIMPDVDDSFQALLTDVDRYDELIYLCASYLKLSLSKMQSFIEINDIKEKMHFVLDGLKREKEVLTLEKDIREKVGRKLSRSQRETLLREQLKAIRDELGEYNHGGAKDILTKIEESEMPVEVLKVATEEFNRLENLHPSSADYHVIRNYIDWLCLMPWNKSSKEEMDLEKSEEILERHHFGLSKIKRRILEHIAVGKLNGTHKGPIICLLGPPGVGKTSLGKSIAEALGRKFAHASLGGMRDDSEIRGHRRTYVGSMPGKVIQSIKRAGVNNPLLLLDEIDKLGSGIHGDPASALLEVLDPEQNSRFVDHYLDVPFDLSKVFFVATANRIDTIPGPLRDRVEVIELSSYTLNEKIEIVKKFILPVTLEEHGLKQDDIELSDELIGPLIESYTRESGLREIKRVVSSLSRSVAYEIVKGHTTPVVIDSEGTKRYLGNPRFMESTPLRKWVPGMATGLAWTPVGGDVLYLECVKMRGNGHLKLTGQLGDIMRESAELAMSYIKSHILDINPIFDPSNYDIHLHIPAGAISKDGPSAGITMLTAIASLVSENSVSKDIGMTGELTLSGSILPVGGLKEKVIAAHRQKIRKIILPLQNEQDLDEIPEEVKKDLEFFPVESAGEALDITLGIKIHNHIKSKDTIRSKFLS
jgi:ATP-dependent Lon protease